MYVSTPAAPVAAIAIPIVCIALSLEFVFSGTFGTTASEFVIYSLAVYFILTQGLRLNVAQMILALCAVAGLLSAAVYNFSSAYGPYLKTIINFGVGILVFQQLSATEEYRRRLLFCLAVCGVILAAYGICQALGGIGPLPDIYTVGGAPSTDQTGRRKLLEVMAWKADGIASTLGVGISSLAYGFHWYSNNYAEYLVFSSIAVWLAFPPEKRPVVWCASQALILSAIVLSAGRTSVLGYGLVTAIFLLRYIWRYRWLAVLFGTLVAAALLPLVGVAAEALLFDGGGTIGGRSALNSHAWDMVTETWTTIFVGADAEKYLTSSISNVHSTFLYYWLFGGVGVAIATYAIIWSWWGSVALRFSVTHDPLHLGAFAAISWLLCYGLTWVVVTAPNSIFIVCMFVCLSASALEGHHGRRRREAVSDAAPVAADASGLSVQ